MKNVSIISFLFIAIQVFNVQAAKAGKLNTRRESFSNFVRLPGRWKKKQKALKQIDRQKWEKNRPYYFARQLNDALRALLEANAVK